MTYKEFLDIAAAWAAIFTAAVAVIGYGLFRRERYEKMRRLERYLKAEKDNGSDKGQRTVTHLVANLGMSETDVLDSAFRSKHVFRTVDVENGKAKDIFLEYRKPN